MVTAPTVAVLATLSGTIDAPIPVDVTFNTWTCPRCRRILRVILGTDPDGWLPDPHDCP